VSGFSLENSLIIILVNLKKKYFENAAKKQQNEEQCCNWMDVDVEVFIFDWNGHLS
jgi:hypothetical protein